MFEVCVFDDDAPRVLAQPPYYLLFAFVEVEARRLEPHGPSPRAEILAPPYPYPDVLNGDHPRPCTEH
jgi:hypothetical protein